MQRKWSRACIYASSSSVYGLKEEVGAHRDMSLEPLTDYLKFKADCEKVLVPYQSEKYTTVTVRPATVCCYSTRERLDIVGNILTNLAYLKSEISVFGGKQYRSNIHIKEMVAAYVMLIEAPKEKIAGEIVNVRFENQTFSELSETVIKLIGDDVKSITTPTADDCCYHISSNKIKEKLGFVASHSMEEAAMDLKKAFENGLLPNISTDNKYFSIKVMQSIE